MTADQQMVAWLRFQILARKAAAEAATEGPWEVTGQDGLDDAWQIYGGVDKNGGTLVDWNSGEPVEVPVRHRVATLNYEDGGGVWRREDADHIVLNQPRDTIARCEAELRILNDYDDFARVAADHPSPPGDPSWAELSAGILGDVIGDLAYAYRHRPGFDSSWFISAPEDV